MLPARKRIPHGGGGRLPESGGLQEFGALHRAAEVIRARSSHLHSEIQRKGVRDQWQKDEGKPAYGGALDAVYRGAEIRQWDGGGASGATLRA